MKLRKIMAMILALVMATALLAGCGGSGNAGGAASAPVEVPEGGYTFPLAEKAEISGLTRFPANTESDPNNRTIYKRLEEKTNVHVNWKAIQADQWGDKIALEMANIKTLPEFISPAGLGDADILKYAKQGVIIPLEDYITPELMPNLTKVFEQAPEYKDMCTDENGHIWTLPWIEQLGVGKTAIQTIGNMPFINTAWLDFLGLEMPKTVDEFEAVLIAFRDNADKLKKEFNIDGDIIPLACIVNGGNEDCRVLCKCSATASAKATAILTTGATLSSPMTSRSSALPPPKAGARAWNGSTSSTPRICLTPTPSLRSGAPTLPRARAAATASASPGTWPTLSA